MGITINDIAKLANVSKTTVSRVLNDKDDVKEDTREKILAIVKEYNYQPSVFAQSILTKRSNCIALITTFDEESMMSNPIFFEIIKGIQKGLGKKGFYFITVFNCTSKKVSDLYLQHRADGFILLTPSFYDYEIVKALMQVEAPIITTTKVLIEENIPNVFHVDCNNYQAAKMAMKHLLSLGHRKIALIGFNLRVNTAVDKKYLLASEMRMEAYRDALKEAGIVVDNELIWVSKDSGFESGRKAVAGLLDEKKEFSAVFCLTDVLAIGVMKELKARKISVPEEISVIGFDGCEISRYVSPVLTTVDQCYQKRAETAARLLVAMIENQGKRKKIILKQPKEFSCKLMKGESTGSIQKSDTI